MGTEVVSVEPRTAAGRALMNAWDVDELDLVSLVMQMQARVVAIEMEAGREALRLSWDAMPGQHDYGAQLAANDRLAAFIGRPALCEDDCGCTRPNERDSHFFEGRWSCAACSLGAHADDAALSQQDPE